jgi:RNase P subunit RPR2
MFNFRIKLKTTTAIYCPYCHSPLVEHGKPVVREDLIAHNELYGVQCRKCGAKGNIRESWSFPKAVQAKECGPEKEGE